MPLTWKQVEDSIAVTDERKAKGVWVDCPGCGKRQQESFFDTVGIERCAECYAPLNVFWEGKRV